MANYLPALDGVFHALADPTRRAVVRRLSRGRATVSELAGPHAMALPSFLKHLKVLKSGRVRTCELVPDAIAPAETWLAEQRALWQGRADRLADYVEQHLVSKENTP